MIYPSLQLLYFLFSIPNEAPQAVPLQAKGYDSHVELVWNSVPDAQGYEVHLMGADGNFTKQAEIKDTLYLDFVGQEVQGRELHYRIISKSSGGKGKTLGTAKTKTRAFSDEELMDMVQYYTFRYFWEGAEPNSGMARERIHLDGEYPSDDFHIVTTGGTGFGLFGLLAGIEREWISREEALVRLERIVGFLEKADRFHGIWPHWLDGNTGKVKPFGSNDNGGDLVESAFLAQGLLAVREYFKDGNVDEQQLADQIDALWQGMEWDWYTRGEQDVLYWHWSPDKEWVMDFAIKGYDECLITYVLAAASPTHRVSPEAYHQGWARGGDIKHSSKPFGYALELKHNGSEELGGPLFWAHYSYLGLSPKGLKDRYADYWQHNINHTLSNRAWCVANAGGFKGYGEDLWGLTASYSVDGYMAHRPGQDIGVISPTAALSSIPYSPEASLKVLVNLYRNYGEKVFGRYGFFDALSPEAEWYPKRYLAIDQGPIVAMIENHRTGMGWNLFMNAPEIQEALVKLEMESDYLIEAVVE
jgi:hypothetical protein